MARLSADLASAQGAKCQRQVRFLVRSRSEAPPWMPAPETLLSTNHRAEADTLIAAYDSACRYRLPNPVSLRSIAFMAASNALASLVKARSERSASLPCFLRAQPK